MATSPRCVQTGLVSPRLALPKVSLSFDSENTELASVRSPSAIPVSPTLKQFVLDKRNCLDQSESQPTWITTLLSTKFYGTCPEHPGLRKNDLNRFCMNHCEKICQYCHTDSHVGENPCSILHVSRYMYHDVLLAKEISNWLDVADVQSYLNNGNRVVYIDRRAQPKSKLAPHAKACVVCNRTLQDPFRFCSVYCRLSHSADAPLVADIPVPPRMTLVQTPVRRLKRACESPVTPASSPSPRRDRSNRKFVARTEVSDVSDSDSSGLEEPEESNTKAVSRAVESEHAFDEFSYRKTPISVFEIPLPVAKAGVRKSKRKGNPYQSPSSHASIAYLYRVQFA